MRLLNFGKSVAVLLSGFAGLSCLTNLYAQDTYMSPDAIFNETESCNTGQCNTGLTNTGQYYTGQCNTPEKVCRSGPFLFFEVDYLFWSRNSSLSSGPIIGGPDAVDFNDLDFGFQSGYRFKTAIAGEKYELEFIWAHIDGWNENETGQLTNGVSFDQGIGGAFAGANFINANTYFRPIFDAASADLTPTFGPNEQLEDEGFGPVGAFVDAAPTYQVRYQSELKDWELMAKYAPVNGRFKLGIGWRHVDLDELASVSLTGTFRAVDNGIGANGGLSHAALTDPNGGNLTLLSGVGDGFNDETAFLGPAGPDVLRFENSATTDNSLNGVQFSLEGLLIQRENFLFDGFLKVGAYHNQARGTITETYAGIVNDDSVYGRSLTDNQSTVAFVGQIGLGTVYRLTDNIRLRGGWEVLFLSGVALAPDQANAVIGSQYRVENNGSMIANGGNIGLEFVY